MADSSKPSWRRGRSDAGRAAGSAGKGWQSRQVKASQSAVSTHRAKLIGLGLLVIALATYFLAKVFFIPVKTPLLVISATEYPAPLPPNGYAQEDVARLAETNQENIQSAEPSPTNLTRAGLLRYLDERLQVRAGGPNKDVVLLYVSAHGAVNDQGEPCLLLSDSSPVDATNWLKFSEIVERIKQRPNAKIVIILDAGRIENEWSLGILYNGFAAQLEKQLADGGITNLHVLTATSGGERAWTAPELGGSVFGYFAAQGLSDEASKNDDLITLRELSDYLTGQVSAWVARNRASVQTPRLLTPLPSERDFAIAYRGKSSGAIAARAEATDRQRIAADWKVVGQSWRQFEQRFQERKLLRYEPLAVAELQRLLLRMEQLLMAGAAYRAEFEAAQTKVRTLLETDPRSRLPADLPAFSFPMQTQFSPSAVNEQARQTVLAKWIEAQGQPKLKEGDPPLPQLDYLGASYVAMRFARQLSPPSRSQIHDVLSLIDATPGRLNAKGDRLPEVGEVLFLRMVDAFVDRPGGAVDFTEAARRYLQQTFAARELAEQAAAPDDERVHHWVQPLVDSADAQRRMSEDALFNDLVSAADESGTKTLLTSGFRFTSQYEAAVQRGQQAAAAYALRDEVWLGLPFLSSWLLRAEVSTRQRVVGEEGTLAAVAAFVQQLAAENHTLAATLDKMLTDNQLESPELPAAVDKVRGDWSKVREPFVAHCQELKDRAGQDKPTLREIGEALRAPSPLLAAEERERLATKYQNILFAEAALSEETAPRAGRVAADSAKNTAELSALASLKQHPAVTMLDRSRLPLLSNLRSPEADADRKEESDIVWLAQRGARVRRWLADLHQAAKDLEDVTSRRLEEATETAANVRAGISEADRLVRAASAFTTGEFPDPAQRMRRVDLHLELLWQAHRALDDFWGPTPGADSETESYFAAVTLHYLNAARRLEDTPKSLVHRKTDLSQLLVARQAAIPGTRVEPQDVRTLGEAPAVQQRVHIAWHKDLPVPGLAALFLEGTVRDSQPELIPVKDRDAKSWRRQTLPLGQSPTTDIVHLVPSQQLTVAKADQELMANLLYRGHRIRRPFAIRGPETVLTTVVDPRLPRKAKVKVRGEGNRRAFILFVFDCSDSMNEGGRLGKAVTGLTRVLDALRGDEHYHVGLYAYGHRARFGAGNQPVGPGNVPIAVNPDRDVELLLPVEPLTDEHCTALTRQLNELKAVGVTPLYYSIRTAAQSNEFQLARQEDLKHVIVITDGIDYQFQERTTADSVKKSLNENAKTADVRVDVVLFDKTALLRDPKAQQIVQQRGTTLDRELSDIQSVAKATGGEYFSAENPDQLTEALRRALKLVKFSVRAADAPPSSAVDGIDLGKEWPLLELRPQPQKYIVRLHGTTRPAEQIVTIEGGEAIELQYDKTEERLVFPAYRRGDAREPFADLVDPLVASERYGVLPILPRKNLNGVEFDVAVQNSDRLKIDELNSDRRKFTPRPRHVWAEVQPLTETEQPVGSTYHFFDAQFVSDKPVPVLQFVVPDWPAGATKASLRMWLKFDFPPLKPNGVALVEELKPIVVDEDIPQVSFRAEIKQVGEGGRGWRLTVWEEHEPGTELFTARVQASPAPDQIRHQFFVGVDTVKHEFDYTEKPAPTVIVTARERITQSAIIVPRVVMTVKD